MANDSIPAELESMSTELMRFDLNDASIEELERRLEMTIVSAPMNVCDADCPNLQKCGAHGNCGIH